MPSYHLCAAAWLVVVVVKKAFVLQVQIWVEEGGVDADDLWSEVIGV